MSKIHCGINPPIKSKRRGTEKECIKNKKVYYWGLRAISKENSELYFDAEGDKKKINKSSLEIQKLNIPIVKINKKKSPKKISKPVKMTDAEKLAELIFEKETIRNEIKRNEKNLKYYGISEGDKRDEERDLRKDIEYLEVGVRKFKDNKYRDKDDQKKYKKGFLEETSEELKLSLEKHKKLKEEISSFNKLKLKCMNIDDKLNKQLENVKEKIKEMEKKINDIGKDKVTESEKKEKKKKSKSKSKSKEEKEEKKQTKSESNSKKKKTIVLDEKTIPGYLELIDKKLTIKNVELFRLNREIMKAKSEYEMYEDEEHKEIFDKQVEDINKKKKALQEKIDSLRKTKKKLLDHEKYLQKEKSK